MRKKGFEFVIDPRACVDPAARIGENVIIGPWTLIGPEVEIGAGTWVGPHVVLKGPTRIGRDNKIFQFASVGEDPQDKKYEGERTFLEIGDRNIIRECCTIHRGTGQGGGVTRIGNDNLFMAYVHIAHDCMIGSQTVFSNNASLAGHVIVEDYAIVSGFSGVHQFCKIGSYSFIGGATMVVKDVLPYTLVNGHDAKAIGLNLTGLKRHNFTLETTNYLRRAYKIIFRSNLTVTEAIKELVPLAADCSEVGSMIEMLQGSDRGITR
jgi:UDP-N-acetylglucosamine acyltransferase